MEFHVGKKFVNEMKAGSYYFKKPDFCMPTLVKVRHISP